MNNYSLFLFFSHSLKDIGIEEIYSGNYKGSEEGTIIIF